MLEDEVLPLQNPRIRVLIADDEPIVLAAVSAVLSSAPDIEVVAKAGNTDEAIRLARRHRPAIALLDVSMPGGGGIRATTELKADLPFLRIIAFSGSGDRNDVFNVLRAGADAYLVKGSSPEEVISAIRRLAAGEGTLSPAVAGEVIGELAEELDRREQAEQTFHDSEDRIRAFLGGRGMSIVFQPLVRLQDGAVVGMEALARFESDPYRPPNAWFEEAEGVGLRDELELEALRLALGSIDRIPRGSYLSVNLSPAIVGRREIDRWIGPLADRVQLEITEYAIVEDYPYLKSELDALREQGVRVAVDDAGAGFSSLRHILRLEPDLIKLDMTLTRGMPDDPRLRALTSALMSFAADVGCEVLAEGIETEQELDALRALGVHFGQGYFLGRPGSLVN
jgi:EAL domain-containing protein (putative c-di-GMP-specific phosphodiesterase class I)/CheY-like chemotaxis protein